MHKRRIFDLRRENFDLHPVFKRLLVLFLIQIQYIRYLRKILSLNNIQMPIFIVLLPIMQKPPLTLRPSFGWRKREKGLSLQNEILIGVRIRTDVLCKTLNLPPWNMCSSASTDTLHSYGKFFLLQHNIFFQDNWRQGNLLILSDYFRYSKSLLKRPDPSIHTINHSRQQPFQNTRIW